MIPLGVLPEEEVLFIDEKGEFVRHKVIQDFIFFDKAFGILQKLTFEAFANGIFTVISPEVICKKAKSLEVVVIY
jgi:hypothetical protein